MCHKIDMDYKKLLWNAVLKEKTMTIYVSVNVVASDIPSVMNSTMTVDPAVSVGLRSASQGWGPRRRLLHQHQMKSEVRTDLLAVIGRD